MASIGTFQSSFGIGFACPIIGGVCVGLRFYSRWYLRNEVCLDDWLCLPALVCTTACCASLLVRAFHDVKGAPNDEEEERFTAQITAAIIIFWAWANTFIKLSILFFYDRILRGRIYAIINKILMACCIVWLLYDIVGWLLFCGTDLKANFEGPWDNCPTWGFQLQIGVFLWDTLLDFAILLLPIPPLWRLQVGLSKKLAIIVIFLLGAFAFFAGLSNAVVQCVLMYNPSFLYKSGEGSFFEGESILMYNWPALEVGVGLIAMNLPSLSFRVLASLPRQLRYLGALSPQRYQGPTTEYAMHSSAQHNTSRNTADFQRLPPPPPKAHEALDTLRVQTDVYVQSERRYSSEESVRLPPLRPGLMR